MREHDVVRLRHMLDESHEVVGFVRGLTRADLDGDRKLVLALVKAIEIIGLERPERYPPKRPAEDHGRNKRAPRKIRVPMDVRN